MNNDGSKNNLDINGSSNEVNINSTTQNSVNNGSQPVTQPFQQPAAQPVQQPAAQPVQQPAVQPVQQPAVQPVQQPAAQPVQQPAAQQVQQPVAQPVQQTIQPQPVLNPIGSSTSNITEPISGAIDTSQVGFVAATEAPKKKPNKTKTIIIAVLLVIVFGLLSYFVFYPLLISKVLNKPKDVFQTVINKNANNITSFVDRNIHDKSIYDIKTTFDSNIDIFKPYSGYTYGLNFGFDPNKEAIQGGFSILNNGVGHSANAYMKDGKKYIRLSTNRKLIYVGDITEKELQEIIKGIDLNKVIKNAKNVNAKEINYLVNKLSKDLINSIDNAKLEKTEGSLNINGKKVKVFENKYNVNQTTAIASAQFILKSITEDKKSLEVLSTLVNIDKSDLEKNLKDTIDKLGKIKVEDDTYVTFIVYTKMGFKPIILGYRFTVSDFSIDASYIKHSDYLNAKLVLSEHNKETNKDESSSFEIVGNTNSGKTNLIIKVNDKEIASIEVREWTLKKKDLRYVINIDEEKQLVGKIILTTDNDKETGKRKLVFSMEMGEEFISFDMDILIDWTSDVSNINTNDTITLSDDELNNAIESFKKEVLNTPLGAFFSTTSGDTNTGIFDYYNKSKDLNTDTNKSISEIN